MLEQYTFDVHEQFECLFLLLASTLLLFLLLRKLIPGAVCNSQSACNNNHTEEDANGEFMGQQNGVQDLLRLAFKPKSPYTLDWGNYFSHVAQCVRLQKYVYPQVSSQVADDERLKYIIKQVAEDAWKERKIKLREGATLHKENAEDILYNELLEAKQKEALNILFDIRSKISDTLLRLTSWILYKLLPRFLSGVVTKSRQIEMLKIVSRKAPKTPLIFLPLHRSHLDYILVSFILLNNDIKSPIVAAGNNLKIPFFGFILRGLGAFFIKRKVESPAEKKDVLYRSILQVYLQYALEAGHNLEFFIEGGRTRSGKPCMPKKGILSIIVKAFMDGSITDALLVPVSVNYEKLVDGNFVEEQMGKRKKPETFKSAAIAIWKVLNSQFGTMRIDFNTPFSLRELVQSFNEIMVEDNDPNAKVATTRQLLHNQSSSSLFGTDVVCEEHRKLVDSIARHVVYDCTVAMSIMSTNAIAFLLLTQFRNGGTDVDVADKLDSLRKELAGRRDVGFSGRSIDVVSYACHILGESLIKQKIVGSKKYFIPNLKIPQVIELAYYANSLSPFFALQSVSAIALNTILKSDLAEVYQRVTKKQLKSKCLEICSLLCYEFVFNRPTQNIEDLLEETFEDLAQKEVIKINGITQTIGAENMRNKLVNLGIVEDDVQESSEDDIYIELNKTKERDWRALTAVVGPILCAYKSTAASLDVLNNSELLEIDLIRICKKNLEVSVEKTDLSYTESISVEYVKNALKLFEKMDVIQLSSEYNLKIYSLRDPYSDSSNFRKFCDQLLSISLE